MMTVWIFGSFEGLVAELLRILEKAFLTVLRRDEPDRSTSSAHEKSATAQGARCSRSTASVRPCEAFLAGSTGASSTDYLRANKRDDNLNRRNGFTVLRKTCVPGHCFRGSQVDQQKSLTLRLTTALLGGFQTILKVRGFCFRM
jgi:hypothetical protein